MASIPVPRSYNQILGDQIDAFLSKTGLKNIRAGSPTLSILEAASQSDLRSSQDIFSLLNSISLDRATGLALDRIGADEDVPRIAEAPSSGTVNISDTTFTKIASKVFQGRPAPLAGSNAIAVTDASAFPASGSIYIGRGTPLYEGPLAYTSKVNAGTYWVLNLAGATLKFHNLGETVILAQGGNRVVSAGAIVTTPQGNVVNAIEFTVLYTATLPDGEDIITGVRVVARKPGVIGNIPVAAINQFPSPPFTGAKVTNPLPFTNGLPIEDDISYRERIKNVRQSRTKGTALAVKTYVTGITAPDENKHVTSARVVTRVGYPTTLYIDDGTGYEERSTGVAIERLVDSAQGGEQYFEVSNRPITKAFLTSTTAAPFGLVDGMYLKVRVGGIEYTHVFQAQTFAAIANANAYEVVSSINSDPNIAFSARTDAGGTEVTLIAIPDTNEDLEVVPDDNILNANSVFEFAVTRVFTMRLYKNDRLLTKDGYTPSVTTNAFADWADDMSGTKALEIGTDQTPTIIYTIVDQDFIDANTGYVAVGKNSLAAWVAVLNAKVPGITASISGSRIILISNLGPDDRAGIKIGDGGGPASLVAFNMFETQTVVGQGRDYTLDRNNAQIRLEHPLLIGDKLAAGTLNTRAFSESLELGPTTLTADARFWFDVDGGATIIRTGLTASTAISINRGKHGAWGNGYLLAAPSLIWSNVEVGDWIILWDSAFPDSMKGMWRIIEATGNTIRIDRPSMRFCRTDHGASAMSGTDQLLITGGYTGAFDLFTETGVTNTCEYFDPTTNTWTMAPPMNFARAEHTQTLLSDGRILVVGGYSPTGAFVNKLEVFDPTTQVWTVGPDGTPAGPTVLTRVEHTAELLNDGRVIVIGGFDAFSVAYASAQIYDPATNSISGSVALTTPRRRHASVKLAAGNFLVAGGFDGVVTIQNSAEIINATATASVATGAMTTPRSGFSLARPSALIVLAVGDENGSATSEIYTVAATTWGGLTAMGGIFYHKKAVATANGEVFAAYLLPAGGPGPSLSQYWSPGDLLWHNVFDATYQDDTYKIGSACLGLATANYVIVIGGQEYFSHRASSDVEFYYGGSHSFTTIDPAINTIVFPAQNGITIARTPSYLQPLRIPSTSSDAIPVTLSYTASTFAAALDLDLAGAVAATYQTDKVRARTNTFEIGGDIALLAANVPAQSFLLTPADFIPNLTGHVGSVETRNSGIGTPEFGASEIVGMASTGAYSVTSGSRTAGNTTTLILSIPIEQNDSDLRVGQAIFFNSTNVNWTSGIAIVTAVGQYKASTQVQSISFNNPGLGVGVVAAQANPGTISGRDTSVYGLTTAPVNSNNIFVGSFDLYTMFRNTDPMPEWPPIFRLNHNREFTSPLVTSDVAGTLSILNLREEFDALPMTHDRYYLASPYAIGPQDDFTVLVDGDVGTKKFAVNFWRQLKPVGSVYGIQNEFTDADNANASLVTAFGSSYNFNDFVVFMRARTKSDGADATRSALWRYYRFGSEGNKVRMRYGLPDGPDATVKFSVDPYVTQVGFEDRTDISVNIAGGSLRTGYTIRPTSKLGIANPVFVNGIHDVFAVLGYNIATAERDGADITTLVLDVPVPLSGIGISPGDNLFFKSTNPNWTSGVISVISVGVFALGQQPITFKNVSLGTGVVAPPEANAGTVSFDTVGETNWLGASILPGDFIRFDAASNVPPAFVGITGRIVTTGPQFLKFKQINPTLLIATSIPVWNTPADLNAIRVFQNSPQTVSAIVAAVNALDPIADESVVAPLRGVVLGSGAGLIDRSTAETVNNALFWYLLTDGVNYVRSTSVPGLNYQFVFKNAVTASLVTTSDWANEEIRISPVTVDSIVTWLNTPAVTGLFTSSSIEASSDASKIQIATITPGTIGSVQVQGGLANSATAGATSSSTVTGSPSPTVAGYLSIDVKTSETAGLTGGQWVSIANINPLAKAVFNAGTVVNSIDNNGLITFAGGAGLYTVVMDLPAAKLQFGRQGRYAVVVDGMNSPTFSMTGPAEGDWIIFSASGGPPHTGTVAISSNNIGRFKIARFNRTDLEPDRIGSVWFENDNDDEQLATCHVRIIRYVNSIAAGDLITINHSLWGVNNQGTWLVERVGSDGIGIFEDYTNTTLLKLVSPDGSRSLEPFSGPSPALGSDFANEAKCIEGTPQRLIKRLISVCPDPVDGRFSVLKFDSAYNSTFISAIAGSIVSPLDKLDFPTDLVAGIDGYDYSVGLVGEANRVLYGDPANPSQYPGIAAAGAQINISGPLVKRIQISLNLRVKADVSTSEVGDRVKSAVAAVINNTGVGVAIAFSDIVAAAGKVVGVQAVTILTPTYGSGNDMILVQPFEKPLIVNIDQDIIVSFTGD